MIIDVRGDMIHMTLEHLWYPNGATSRSGAAEEVFGARKGSYLWSSWKTSKKLERQKMIRLSCSIHGLVDISGKLVLWHTSPMDPMEYSSSLFRLFQSWFSSNCWIIYDSKGLERNQKFLNDSPQHSKWTMKKTWGLRYLGHYTTQLCWNYKWNKDSLNPVLNNQDSMESN